MGREHLGDPSYIYKNWENAIVIIIIIFDRLVWQ
jgi:hypothetical protein